MSVVVAIKEGNKVYLGCDSQVTKGGTRTTLKNPNNYKVWKVAGVDNCLMGSVGNVRDANIVRLMNGLVTEYNVFKNHVDYEFVVKKIVPDIVDELKQYGMVKDEKFVDFIDSSFIFAFQDQLFVIGRDRSVIEVDDYVAIGSGEDQAIGSLLSLKLSKLVQPLISMSIIQSSSLIQRILSSKSSLKRTRPNIPLKSKQRKRQQRNLLPYFFIC